MLEPADMPRRGEFTILLARLRRRVRRQRWVIAVACLIALMALLLASQYWFLTLAALAALLAAAMLAPPVAVANGRSAGAGGIARPRAAPLSPEVQALVSALPDPCLLLSADGRIAFQNGRAREVLGAAQTGRPVSTLLRAPDISEAVRAAISGRREVSVEYFERIPVARWFEAHVAPVFETASPPGTSQDLIGLVLVLHDLTQQQRVERMRVDFVANASHELRTPLASLAGFIETLQSSARQDEKARERFLEIMREQAFRMSRLIDDLLSLSRIELNAHVRPSTPVDIGDIVAHVSESLAPLAEAEGVAIELSRPPGPLMVAGDRDELVQVFQNLIENAVKYGASGKRVEVRVERVESARSRHAAVVVHDFGPGIAPEHVPRLTERFYRVDEAHSRAKGGTGLGLAIAKHILNRHRATLDISSAPGEGSSFTVRLELREPPPEPERAAPSVSLD